jgi:translation initiation factor IF-3
MSSFTRSTDWTMTQHQLKPHKSIKKKISKASEKGNDRINLLGFAKQVRESADEFFARDSVEQEMEKLRVEEDEGVELDYYCLARVRGHFLGFGNAANDNRTNASVRSSNERRGEMLVTRAFGRGGGRGRGGRGRGGGGRKSGGGRGRSRGPWRNPNQGPLRNEQLLEFEELRILGPEKEMFGVMQTEDALKKAEEMQLDLVMVSPEADPPVAKFMDYSKYKYEKEKKDREKKRQAKLTQIELKEVKMRYNIDTHDYDVRLRASQKFLTNGDKVKVICQFRGRENDFRHIGREMFEKFVIDIEEFGSLERQPGMEGNSMTMYIVPRVTKDEVNKRYEQSKKERDLIKQQQRQEGGGAVGDDDDDDDDDEEYDDDDEEFGDDDDYDEEEEFEEGKVEVNNA